MFHIIQNPIHIIGCVQKNQVLRRILLDISDEIIGKREIRNTTQGHIVVQF